MPYSPRVKNLIKETGAIEIERTDRYVEFELPHLQAFERFSRAVRSWGYQITVTYLKTPKAWTGPEAAPYDYQDPRKWITVWNKGR